jgi:tetratricopeptide (TPR) repeat protein
MPWSIRQRRLPVMPVMGSIAIMNKLFCTALAVASFFFATWAYAAPADDAVERGRAALKAMDIAGAMAHFDAALQADPKHADASYERGMIYMKAGKLDEAIADFTTTVISNPAHGRAYAHRGEVKIVMHNWNSAFEDFNKAVEASPKDYQVLVIRASYLLGKGDKAAAKADMDAAIALADPHAAEVLTKMREQMGLGK